MLNKILLFINKYNNEFIKLVQFNHDFLKSLSRILKILIKIKKNKKKILIFGNGGSAAIASHFSLDVTNVTGITCQNFNDSSLITCFSNDFGYENWVSRAVQYYYNPGDLIILISSKGESKNMLKAATKIKNYKQSTLVTFTGFNSKNNLKKLGDINFWVNSSRYNQVENIHQYWLLLIVDLIAYSSKYK
jgi:D-sedoheptulose 7-phosphate isomerase